MAAVAVAAVAAVAAGEDEQAADRGEGGRQAAGAIAKQVDVAVETPAVATGQCGARPAVAAAAVVAVVAAPPLLGLARRHRDPSCLALAAPCSFAEQRGSPRGRSSTRETCLQTSFTLFDRLGERAQCRGFQRCGLRISEAQEECRPQGNKSPKLPRRWCHGQDPTVSK